MHFGGNVMRKCRFSILGLGVLFCFLSIAFRDYYRLFLGFACICIGLNAICFYFLERKEKGNSSKLYILGVIIEIILVIFLWF